jgi:hypothetical protein
MPSLKHEPMNLKTEIEEIEKRFDESGYQKMCRAGSDTPFEGELMIDYESAKAFFRAELLALLSKFAAEINGDKEGVVEWENDYRDGWNAHHRSVAEKAEEIISSLSGQSPEEETKA